MPEELTIEDQLSEVFCLIVINVSLFHLKKKAGADITKKDTYMCDVVLAGSALIVWHQVIPLKLTI